MSFLGLSTSASLSLIKRICIANVTNEQILSEFSDYFGGIATLNTAHQIEIKDNVSIVAYSVRKISLTLKPSFEKLLKRMASLLIIEPVQKSCDWVNGLKVAKKSNGKLMVCIDLRSLNNVIKHEDLHLPDVRRILFFKTRHQFRLLVT